MSPPNARSRPAGNQAASERDLHGDGITLNSTGFPPPPNLSAVGAAIVAETPPQGGAKATPASGHPIAAEHQRAQEVYQIDTPSRRVATEPTNYPDAPRADEPDVDRWDEALAPPVETLAPAAEPARLDVIRADAVELRRVVYLWQHRIPVGAVTVMPGEEGIGKSTIGARLIADTTTGNLAGEYSGTPRDVVVLAAEDGIEDVFVPRLVEAGADLSRVHIVRGRIGSDIGGRDVIIPRDLHLLGDLVRERHAVMLWIDSLVTTLPDEMKSISYKDTAKALRSISEWAERQRVAVAAPWHLNKATGSDTAVRMMDSRAFRTAVRSVLLVVPDPDAPEGVTQGIVALDKSNAGTLAVPALRYRLRSATYVIAEVDPVTNRTRDVTATCGVADWIGEVAGDGRAFARDALTPTLDRADGAQQWLRDHLADVGETPRTAVLAAAGTNGFSESAIKRAARAVKVHSRDDTGQDPNTGRPYRRALWSLPQSGPHPVQSGHTHPADPAGPTGEVSGELIDPVIAGQRQSGQSGQSGLGRPTGKSGDPTGKPPRSLPMCACGNVAESSSATCWRCA